jgi:putative hydrolase of the HAD superfamily
MVTEEVVMPGPKGVFFDLFGTLLVYGDMKAAWADWLKAFHLSLRPRGLALSEADFAGECDRFFGREEPARADDGFTVYERRIHHACVELGVRLARKDVARVANHTAAEWQKYVQLDPDASAVLQALAKDKVLALVSNYDHPPHVRALLRRHRLGRYFRAVVVSGDVGVKKPDPRVFDPALRETGLRPSEVVYVGDTEDDVAAARAAGIAPVLIRRLSDADTDGADFKSNSAADQGNGAHGPCDDVTTVRSLHELVAMFG